VRRPHRRTRLALAALAAVSLGLAGCADSDESSSSDGDPAATTEEVTAPDGTELVQVTLAEGSAEQLGIRFAPIAEEGADLVIPLGALVYSPDGGEWVYTEVEPRSFLRQRVTVREVAGDRVLLSDGPEPGTEVVTRGTIELYGVEEGIGG
jgi:hypothetical protein